MIASLVEATSIDNNETEILGYWNSSADAEKISNASGQEFLMAQREPYSFARSMNNLAELANAEMLINSLDSQSV